MPYFLILLPLSIKMYASQGQKFKNLSYSRLNLQYQEWGLDAVGVQ